MTGRNAAPEYRCPQRIQNLPVTNWDKFDRLPDDVQAEAWAQLRVETDRRVDGIARYESERLEFPEDAKPAPARTWTPRPTDVGAELDDIPTGTYVHALTGLEVEVGRRAHCPLPGHEDKRPDFKPYPDGHFNCFGCNRGGRIWDFGAHLWGYSLPLRGDVFREVRARLLEVFGRGSAM